MNIHEYQAKEVLKGYGVRIQEGIVASTPEEAHEAAVKLNAQTGTSWFVIKAQIHAGGRGKGGGVKLAKTLDDVKEKVIFNLSIQFDDTYNLISNGKFKNANHKTDRFKIRYIPHLVLIFCNRNSEKIPGFISCGSISQVYTNNPLVSNKIITRLHIGF